jgi:glycosyltransferase involved in cell wall biosynthesis
MSVTNILIDFGAIKSGGGAQLATNFLEKLAESSLYNKKVAVIFPEIGPIAKLSKQGVFKNILISPSSYARRWLFETIKLQRFIKSENIQKIFTFFGAGLPHSNNVKSIVTVAYPIICYPESAYWNYIRQSDGIRIKIINWFRKERIKNASKIIVETEIMRHRIMNTLRCDEKKISIIPPAVSAYVDEVKYRFDRCGKKFVFVSGNESHKNLWRLYDVASLLRKLKWKEFSFILTVTRGQYFNDLRMRNCSMDIINSHFNFLGNVNPRKIMDVYKQADFVVSLSDLESFSNNYMEAWKVGIPLIASNRDFAKSICGQSAIYVEPHNIENVAESFIKISTNVILKRKLVEAGKDLLKKLPTQEQRFNMIMKEISQS